MYRVDEATCTGCGDCVAACPAGAISLVDRRARIDDASCAECGSCADACPQGAIVMADVLNPAYAAVKPTGNLAAVAPVAASIKAIRLAQQPEVEVLPAEVRHSGIWSAVCGALVWAARELLPEVMAAWRTSRVRVVQPTSRKSVTFGQVASRKPHAGHRHRWGRV